MGRPKLKNRENLNKDDLHIKIDRKLRKRLFRISDKRNVSKNVRAAIAIFLDMTPELQRRNADPGTISHHNDNNSRI
jgi:hypothetical protein